jgi:hypothetical protein
MGQKGGKQPGAGRPKGKKSQTTLEKEAVLAAWRLRVLQKAEQLFHAQYSKAVGSVMVFRVDETEDDNGKVKREHVHVTDPDEIKEFLDECEGMNGYSGDKYYFITEVLPDNKAIDSMMDRTFGKAQQTLDIGNKPGETFKQKFIVEVVNGSNEDTSE